MVKFASSFLDMKRQNRKANLTQAEFSKLLRRDIKSAANSGMRLTAKAKKGMQKDLRKLFGKAEKKSKGKSKEKKAKAKGKSKKKEKSKKKSKGEGTRSSPIDLT